MKKIIAGIILAWIVSVAVILFIYIKGGWIGLLQTAVVILVMVCIIAATVLILTGIDSIKN